MYIAVDFDGTIVDHQFPEIGPFVPGAVEWLKRLQAAGALLILYTMRSDGEEYGNVLTDAIEACRAVGLEFWAVNDNPSQNSWTNSRKVYAHYYIDDLAAGVPLRANPRMGGRPFVDWEQVGPLILSELERANQEASTSGAA